MCSHALGPNYCRCSCVSGNASDPCGCPEGFHRYGSRCLSLLDQPGTQIEAVIWCRDQGAHLVVPRSKEELRQVRLAAVQLQTAPFAKVWHNIQYIERWGSWYGSDGCHNITQHFWARGQPEHTVPGSSVVYSPPSADNNQPGWYSVPPDNTEPYLPLCQLKMCQRPDCQQGRH